MRNAACLHTGSCVRFDRVHQILGIQGLAKNARVVASVLRLRAVPPHTPRSRPPPRGHRSLIAGAVPAGVRRKNKRQAFLPSACSRLRNTPCIGASYARRADTPGWRQRAARESAPAGQTGGAGDLACSRLLVTPWRSMPLALASSYGNTSEFTFCRGGVSPPAAGSRNVRPNCAGPLRSCVPFCPSGRHGCVCLPWVAFSDASVINFHVAPSV